MAKLTEEKIAKIQELYASLGTYAAVAREIGCAPTTVKKYVELGANKIIQPKVVVNFDVNSIPKFNPLWFTPYKNLGAVCIYTEQELAEIKKLWEEMTE